MTRDNRRQVLSDLYGKLDREVACSVLADDFFMHEAGRDEKIYGRDDFMSMVYGSVLPAIPDFQWCAATTNELDRDGFVVVTVQARGHHTGVPFSLPGLPAIEPSGRHFSLPEQALMVRVVDGLVKEIKVFPVRGAGPLGMYVALGGELPLDPAKALAQDPSVSMPLP
ncbi:hypothetical protein FOA52_002037 [Chlamydomonas sp. UWO 241]|nr:hypothetical protein FOA52_002037 [Chlamydomonas sp. UWO 241]